MAEKKCIYRLLKPTKLQMVLIYFFLDRKLLNYANYDKSKRSGIKQVTFSSKFKLHPFLNQVYVENVKLFSDRHIYHDLNFTNFMDMLIFYTSDVFIESESEKTLKKELGQLN